jgi:hypothetical protein
LFTDKHVTAVSFPNGLLGHAHTYLSCQQLQLNYFNGPFISGVGRKYKPLSAQKNTNLDK